MSTITAVVEVPSSQLDTIYARLGERRILIEKEVLKYGEAPAGIKEVFELCRGFERAYVEFVNESPVAGKVKEAFMGEKGLAGAVRKAPLEKVFQLSNVKTVCRYADGYQPHLVSPENGVRALGIEALDLVAGPVKACVQQVYSLLLNAAREAAEKAGHYTEAALVGALPMYVPDFKTVVMPAIVVAIDEWKADAERMAMMLVDMERSYITAGFFRATMHNRYEKIQQQQAMAMAASSQAGEKGGVSGMFGNAAKATKSYFPAFGASKEPEPPAVPIPQPRQPAAAPPADAGSEGSDNEAGAKGGAANFGNMSSDPNDFVAAYFEKYGSNDSALSTSLPNSWKWQRRFFIFSDSQKMLYYFKSPEDVPKANGLRGQVNIAECMVEDLDERGQPRHPGSPNPNSTDKAHWMMRIRHKDPRQSAVKEHNSIILRAETFQAKVEWLARLRRATGEVKQQRAPAKQVSQKTQQGEGAEGAGDPSQNGHESGDQAGAFGAHSAPSSGANWAEAEPHLDTHLGQGARAFRAEHLRDSDGRLPPAPRVLLNPMRATSMMDKIKESFQTSFEVQYDALLEQFGSDMSVYTRMVCDTICTTVPKAIVHCMIKKSQKSLLEKLFTVIHKLTPQQMEQLLKEEDSIVLRRLQARKIFEDVKSMLFQVQSMLERVTLANPSDRPEKVTLPVNAFAYAGMPNILTAEQRQYYDKLFTDQYAPDCMRFWANPPQMRSVLPGSVSIAAREAAEYQARQQQQAPPQQQQQQPGPSPGGPRGPPPPGQGPPIQRPSMGPGPPQGQPMRSPGPGQGPAPPVPMRPAAGAVQQPMGQPIRRAPPPPPGAAR